MTSLNRRTEPRPDRSWLLWTPFAAVLAALLCAWAAPWAVRGFALVPAPARIEEVRDGVPRVLVDTGAAAPVEAAAHGAHAPGGPLDVTVRHVPSLPEAAVLADHLSPWPFVLLAVLACLAVPAVWGPSGLRAAWNRGRRRPSPRSRRRRPRPDRDRDRGARLWRPVLAGAVSGTLCAAAGALLAARGLVLAAVSTEDFPDLGAVAPLTAAWLLLPAGAFLGVRALLRYADRAPVRTVPAEVRTLPARLSSGLLLCAVALAGTAAAGGWAWGLYREHRAMAATDTGTALVSEVRERDVRGGCRAEADLHYTVADLSYGATLDVPCEDTGRLRSERFVDVEWSRARPEYVRWTP